MNKKEINTLLSHRLFKKKLIENNITFDDLKKFAPNARTLEEAIYMIKTDINIIPSCAYKDCTNDVPFRYYSNSNQFYPSGCCEHHTKCINNLKKYGVENISQIESIKRKKESTTLKNYGVKNPKQNTEIAKKIKKTIFEKYGGFGYGGQIKDNINETMLVKYNVINPMLNAQNKKKLIKVLFDKIVARLEGIVIPNFTFEEYQGSAAKQEWTCCTCGTLFEGKIDNGAIPRCHICFPNEKMSYGEKELFNSIFTTTKIQSDRSVLNKKELDIYLPDDNLAIEFNGIYWHSELNGKDRVYHLNKTLECEKKGIQLLHIFETEWYYKKNIILSIINAKLGKFSKRLYARKCEIKEINSKIKNIFLEENHLQGQDKSSVKIGLFYDEELISIMTFGKSRYNKNYQYEMHRYCNKVGYQIVGGASKLWKYFLRNHNPISVITYADRRFSDGTFYEKIGFTKKDSSPPNFFIINKSKLESRLNWQKHLLKDKLDKFDGNLTAWENLQLNGYDRIWDCGNHKFIWESEYS